MSGAAPLKPSGKFCCGGISGGCGLNVLIWLCCENESGVIFRGDRNGHPGGDVPKILNRINAPAAVGFDFDDHHDTVFTRFSGNRENLVLIALGGRVEGILELVVGELDPNLLNQHTQTIPEGDRCNR